MAAHRFKSENKDAEKQLRRYPCDVLGVLRDQEIKSAYPKEKKNALSLHDCSIKKAELEQEQTEKELVQEGGGWGICTN
ncbi:hypothetical protein Bca101_076279 [Brassica carinata]